MLTETERAVLIDDINSNRLDFTYGTFVPDVEVYRFGAGFKKKLPYVLIDFLPASRNKFRSVSNAIGIDKGKYVEYGYCQLEYVAIKCYCNEFHDNKEVIGRLLAEHILQVIRKHVLKNWDYLLRDMAACIDKAEDISIKNPVTYVRKHATKVIVFELEFYLRTQFRWRKTPDDYVPAPVERVGVYMKENREVNYEYEEIKYEEE